MSVADKLTQIAENEQRVYKAGANDVFRQIWDGDLTTITIPKTVTALNGSINVPNFTTLYFDVPELAAGNNITPKLGAGGDGYTLIIGKNVKTIPAKFCPADNNYGASPIKSIEFEDGGACSYIGVEAFYYNFPKLTGTLYVKGLNMTIDKWAFYGGYDNLSKIKLKGVSILNDRSFAYHKEVKSIVFLDKPTTVNINAFLGCDGVTDIYVPWSNGEVANIPWGASKATVHYDYPTNIEFSTKTDEDSGNNYLIVEGEGAIPIFAQRANQLWYDDRHVSGVVVKEGITEIGERAFAGFSYASTVTLPSTLKTIGTLAFDGFGSNVTDGIYNLRAVTLPEGLETIGKRAFQKTGLNTLTIPSTVKKIEERIFEECPYIKTVTFKGKPDAINANAFDKCESLTDIYVPWDEGTFKLTPWGAPETATIHYNSEV